MHTITINIKDDNVAKKVLWFLKHLKDEGVEIADSKADELDKLYLKIDKEIKENKYTSVSNEQELNDYFEELERCIS